MAKTEARPEIRETLVQAREEYAAGYAVLDPLGRKVGRVGKLYLNPEGIPEYVMTKTGLLGLKSVLLPVQFAAVDKEQRVLRLQ